MIYINQYSFSESMIFQFEESHIFVYYRTIELNLLLLMTLINNWRIIVLACLTLGLAPYFPEPHVLGKLRWLFGGAVGMQPMDYFDLILHAFPFILLIRILIITFKKRKNRTN